MADNSKGRGGRPAGQGAPRGGAAYEFCSRGAYTAVTGSHLGTSIFDYYSPRQLSSILKDPMGNNDVLRKISLMLYSANGVYTNTVDYMTAMPTLDSVIVTHGKNDKKKKLNREKMQSVLYAIKHKEIVRDALFRGMIEGVAFYYFETASRPPSAQKYLSDFEAEGISEINELGISASIISLPTDYTQIVGIKNSSYVIAFNLNYFSDYTGESLERKLRKYPKEIRDAYHERMAGGPRGDVGNWVVLDSDKTIVHKIRSKREEKWGRPLVLAAINDILYGDYFVDTKRGVLDEINNKIVYQTLPEGKEKGTSALTKKQQEDQHNTVRQAVTGKNANKGISFFSVAAGTKIATVDPTNTDIFDEKYESNLNDKVSLDMGIASGLLNGSGSGSYSSQQNNLDLLSSQLFQWIEQIERELNKCISANIIRDRANWVELKYLPITNVNKGRMVGYAKDLYLQGKGSLSLWASACGISTDVFFALLDQELDDDIEHKYPVHQTSYTFSAGADGGEGGRPVDEETGNEKTMSTRGTGGNISPRPSTEK